MTARHFVLPILTVLAILLGGASRAGYAGNLALQLLSIPVIGWALLRQSGPLPVPARTLLLLALALVGVVLVQLVPLPPAIWTALPGRARVAEGFTLVGQELPWLALSLNPGETVASLLWLLPAFAALLAIVRLGAYRTTPLAWSLIGVTIASVMVAALQLTGGPDSPFYFYDVTNPNMGVGFFANSNHQATLLLCTLPFTAALYAARRRSGSVKGASGLAVVLSGAAAIIVAGLAINGSLAGAGLGVAVAVASLLLLRYRKRPVPAWAPVLAGFALAGAVAFVFLGPTTGGVLLEGAGDSTSSRREMVGTTLQAAGDYFPAGSGSGSFAGIYRLYEDPANISNTWVNHAHSDVAEIALETGIVGIGLMLLLLLWWTRRAYVVWIMDDRPDHFARAATLASAAIIAHSFVDYPLRTAAISTILAICLALMAQPRPSARAKSGSGEDGEGPRHLVA